MKKLKDDANRLVEFGRENIYLETAFYNVFGKRLIERGYVDGSYVLRTLFRGTYYSKLKDSKLQKLFAKSCITSENVEIMINYLENIVGKPTKLGQLEEEALIFWIFLPYLSASKREKREIYLLHILQSMLLKWRRDEKKSWNLAVSYGVIFDKDICNVEIVTSVEEYTRYIFSLKKEHGNEMLFYRGHSQLNYLLQPNGK